MIHNILWGCIHTQYEASFRRMVMVRNMMASHVAYFSDNTFFSYYYHPAKWCFILGMYTSSSYIIRQMWRNWMRIANIVLYNVSGAARHIISLGDLPYVSLNHRVHTLRRSWLWISYLPLLYISVSQTMRGASQVRRKRVAGEAEWLKTKDLETNLITISCDPPQGKRSHGRPARTYIDQLIEDTNMRIAIESYGRSWIMQYCPVQISPRSFKQE